MYRSRSRVVFPLLILVAALAGCQVKFEPGPAKPGGNNPVRGEVKTPLDPAEKPAVDIITQGGGFVKQEEGHVIEINLVQGGAVKDDDLRPFAALARLKKMLLMHSKITGPGLKHLVGLKDLTELDLSGSKINDAGAKQLAALQQLKTLDISGCKITGPGYRELASLTELENLSATGGAFSDTAAFHVAANLKQLKKLYVNNNGSLSDTGVTELARMPNLETLSVHGTSVNDKGLKALQQLKTLRELELSFFMTDESLKIIAGCKNLTTLRLFNAQRVTDKGLEELGSLTKLKVLQMDNTKISHEAITAFIKAHPNCDVKQRQF